MYTRFNQLIKIVNMWCKVNEFSRKVHHTDGIHIDKTLKNKTLNRYHNSVGHLVGTAKANPRYRCSTRWYRCVTF
jgi:hypothetical protein